MIAVDQLRMEPIIWRRKLQHVRRRGTKAGISCSIELVSQIPIAITIHVIKLEVKYQIVNFFFLFTSSHEGENERSTPRQRNIYII